MEQPKNMKKWKILLSVLLLLLMVSLAGLGITLITQNDLMHPTVMVPVTTEESTGATEETAQTTAPTEPETTAPTEAETTVPTEAETTAPTEAETTAPTEPETTAPAESETTKPTEKPSGGSSGSTTQVEATKISLYNRKTGDNEKFYVENMVPGDAVTQYYCVRVSHSKSVNVRFAADIRKGTNDTADANAPKLEDVLRCYISIGGKEQYHGLLKDLTTEKPLKYKLITSSKTVKDVVYEISVYLDTTVDNQYQNRELLADFQWWVDETENLEAAPTGDRSHVGLWAVLSGGSFLALLALLVVLYRQDPRLARLAAVLLVLALLVSALCIITYAADWIGVSVKDNWFQTGVVKLDLNDGKAVIGEDEEMFQRLEPGMTVKKEFYLKNESTVPVYYKLFLDGVEGELKDVLEVTITDGNDILYHGTPAQLNRFNVGRPMERLELGQRKDLTIRFYFPADAGNAARNQELQFRLCATAVQVNNNPDGVFE